MHLIKQGTVAIEVVPLGCRAIAQLSQKTVSGDCLARIDVEYGNEKTCRRRVAAPAKLPGRGAVLTLGTAKLTVLPALLPVIETGTALNTDRPRQLRVVDESRFIKKRRQIDMRESCHIPVVCDRAGADLDGRRTTQEAYLAEKVITDKITPGRFDRFAGKTDVVQGFGHRVPRPLGRDSQRIEQQLRDGRSLARSGHAWGLPV